MHKNFNSLNIIAIFNATKQIQNYSFAFESLLLHFTTSNICSNGNEIFGLLVHFSQKADRIDVEKYKNVDNTITIAISCICLVKKLSEKGLAA